MAINEEWQAMEVAKIAPEELQALLKSQNPKILDVRPLDYDRDKNFIAGSEHCPLVHLSARYLTIEKDRPLVITDWAMKQSPMAAKFLISKGYTVAGVLKGGIERWEAEKLPVVSK
jgi:rhodanese-related sulfurtransferase